MRIILDDEVDPDAILVILRPMKAVTIEMNGVKYSIVSMHDQVEPIQKTIDLDDQERLEIKRRSNEARRCRRSPREVLGDILPKPPNAEPDPGQCWEICRDESRELKLLSESVWNIIRSLSSAQLLKLAKQLGTTTAAIKKFANGGTRYRHGKYPISYITRSSYVWLKKMGARLPPPSSLLYSHPAAKYRKWVVERAKREDFRRRSLEVD
jgi:hypothetical protein